MEKNILEIYRNYLFLVQTREEYGDKYGDTEELQKIYEKKLENVLRLTPINTSK